MQNVFSPLLICSILISFYMSWNIGAGDVANSMGTSVGSGSLKLKQAVIIASVLELVGAFFFGGSVSTTIQSSIIDTSFFQENLTLLSIGMLSSLLASGIWLQLASFFGWPVSTTHTIVGAIVGFGIITNGVESINWIKVLYIGSTWIFSPLIGGTISFLIFFLLKKKIFYSMHPVSASKKFVPYLCLLMSYVYIFICMIHFKIDLFTILLYSTIGSFGSFLFMKQMLVRIKITPPQRRLDFRGSRRIRSKLDKAILNLQKIKNSSNYEPFRSDIEQRILEIEKLRPQVSLIAEAQGHKNETKVVEKIFSFLQIISASIMALAHGANDVSNAVAPAIVVINQFMNPNHLILGMSIQKFMLLVGGFGIVLGVATWGWRVIETIGKKITELTPTRGFAAEFGCSVTVMLASYIKMPVSTTHVLVGSIFGVGIARGIGALNISEVKKIIISWIITIPAGAIISSASFFILKKILI